MMKLSKKALLLTTLCTAFALHGCDNMASSEPTTSHSTAKQSMEKPTPTTGFRYSDAENYDIANENKLSWRVFYDKPSTGPDAEWFDAVKRGDLPTVKYMVENGQDIEAKDVGSLEQTALGWAAFIGYEHGGLSY